MNQSASTAPLGASTSDESSSSLFHAVAAVPALLSFAFVLIGLLAPQWLPPKALGWLDAALIFTMAIATLVSLSRRLPAQNVLLAATVIGTSGGIIHGIGTATSIPFGPFIFNDPAGPQIVGVAWMAPLLWVVIILNSRGVARLMLRPWRKVRTYGFWLLGLNAALTLMFSIAQEPYMAAVKRYWLWNQTRFPVTWGSAPPTNFLGWLVAALLILAFATPAMIDKRHRQHSPKRKPDYQPLVIWVLAMVLFSVGAATKHFWPATIVPLVFAVIVASFAVRGARW